MSTQKSSSCCPVCAGTMQVQVRTGDLIETRGCECRRAYIHDRMLLQLPPRFRQFSLEALVPRNDRQERLLTSMRKFPGASYALLGDSNIGKTTMAAALFSSVAHGVLKQERYLMDPHLPIWWVTMNQLQTAFQNFVCGRGPQPPWSPRNLLALHDQGKTPRVFIDECDKSRGTEFAVQTVSELIATLDGLERKQLVITSNMSGEELGGFFGVNVARRMLGMPTKQWECFSEAKSG